MMICAYCEINETEFHCPRCGEPTCGDCFETMTVFNAGNELDCKQCVSDKETELEIERRAEEEEEESKKRKREERNSIARARYNSPEQQERRRALKAQRKRERAEEALRSLKEAFSIIKDLGRW